MPIEMPAPVADQIQPPSLQQGLGTLSSLLGIKQQQIAIGTAQAQQQQVQAQAQQESQTASQRAAVAQWIQTQDPMDQVGPDGTVDLDSILTGPAGRSLAAAAGDSYPQVVKSLIDGKNSQLQTKQWLANLNGTLRSQFMQTVGSLSNDPDVQADNAEGRQKVQAAVSAFGTSGGPDAQRIAGVYNSQLQRVPAGHLQAALRAVQMQGADIAQQVSAQQPGYTAVNTGTSTNLYQTNPYGPNPQQPPASLPAPAQVVRTAGDQLAVVNPATATQRVVTPPLAPPGANPPGASPPGANPPSRLIGRDARGNQVTADTDPMRPGTNDQAWRYQTFGASVADAQKQVLGAQDQDANYGTNMETADMIRRYSSSTNTGPGTSAWTHTLGVIGSRFGAQNVADTQTLASFLDLQSSRLRDSMGLPQTNAGLAASQEMGTSVESQRNAIQAKTDYYQALTQLYHQYRTGLDAAGNRGVNSSPSEVARFKSAFTANADPVATEIRLAQARGDTAAAQKILGGLSPQQRALVAQHGRNLDLISQGQLPQ